MVLAICASLHTSGLRHFAQKLCDSGSVSSPDAAPPEDRWRTLAHPLRSRLLAHLRLHGAASGAELARELGTNTGATSYHLRVLEDAGLVEDTGLGDGRSRMWAASETDDDGSPTTTRVATEDDDPETAAWLAHDYVDLCAQRNHAWIDGADAWPAGLIDECGLKDDLVIVTTDQLAALRSEIDAVVARYRRAGGGTPGALRVAVWSSLLPVDRPRP